MSVVNVDAEMWAAAGRQEKSVDEVEADGSWRRIKFKRLHPDAVLPSRGTPFSSGLDLVTISGGYVTPNGVSQRVSFGIAVEIPPGYEGHIRPRSGLSAKGLHVAFGTIDSDYRGELSAVIWSTDGRESLRPFSKGTRIAQLVIVPVRLFTPEWADELSTTTRGEGGFGSTGK